MTETPPTIADLAPSADPERRVDDFTRDAKLSFVANLLSARRHEILVRWLDAARQQPAFRSNKHQDVADHIPALFDAIVRLLDRSAPVWVDPGAPLDDPDVLRAAQGHAAQRFQQGLQPADVVAEFRLLRQEVGRALRYYLADSAPTSDVSAAELIVHDALDGAIALALAGLTQQVEEAREEFLATTMHEVRQPITSIKAGVQLAERLLSRPEPDVAAALTALKRGEAAADQMSVILNRLSQVSRLALGHLELNRKSVSLVEVVRDVLARLDPDTAKRVRLIVSAGEEAIGEWDRGALDEVIANLVSNAAKYSAPDTPIEIAILGTLDDVHLTFRDSGIGLEPDELQHLFRRYARGPASVVREVDGLGLGLYLVRGIVDAHGGRIWAESPGRGQGATFHVVLPRRTPLEAAASNSIR